jgi:hypothetical protein
MKKNHSSFNKACVLINMVVLLFFSACNILPFGTAWFAQEKAQSTLPAGTIFYDDFSSNTSGWDQTETDLGGTDYMDGSYHILVNEKNTDYFSTLYRTYADIGLQVDAQYVEGTYDNDYGLICRYQDEKNFYAGLISSDGYYGIFKIQNGEYTVLGHDTMLQSDSIVKDGERNQIVFNCYKEFLFLYVNGNLLDVQQDKTFSTGDVGMIAGSFEDVGVHVLFDNFYLIDVTQTMNQENQE